MKFTIVLVVFVATAVRQIIAEQPPKVDVTKKKNSETTHLFAALFEKYNREIIPDGVQVKFGMALITTKLDQTEHYLDSNVWLRMVWNDHRLKWNADDFGGVGVLRVSPSNVWIPDIRLYNSADTRHGDLKSSCDQTPNVLIYPNGEVLWVPPCRFYSRCAPAFDQSLDDPQTCGVKFGSWTYDGFVMNMTLYNDKNFVDMSDFDDATDWKVLDVPGERTEKYYPCCEEPYIDIKFNITVQRKPAIIKEEDRKADAERYRQWFN